MSVAPFRSCCGQRHAGMQCPDGLVMCCLCFDRVHLSELAMEDGRWVDVCKVCAEAERAARRMRGDR